MSNRKLITVAHLANEFRRLSRTLFFPSSAKWERKHFESAQAFDLYLKLKATFPAWYDGHHRHATLENTSRPLHSALSVQMENGAWGE